MCLNIFIFYINIYFYIYNIYLYNIYNHISYIILPVQGFLEIRSFGTESSSIFYYF